MTVDLELSTLIAIVTGAALLGVAIGRQSRGAAAAAAPTPVKLPEVPPPDVVTALAEGRTIDAIKAYRNATGCGLKEAKEVCDELVRRSRAP